MPFQLDLSVDLSEEEDTTAAAAAAVAADTQLRSQDPLSHQQQQQQQHRWSDSNSQHGDSPHHPSHAHMLQTAGSSSTLLLPLGAAAPGAVAQQSSHASSWVKHESCMLSQFGTSRAMQMLNRR
jgi:hypothetical protein